LIKNLVAKIKNDWVIHTLAFLAVWSAFTIIIGSALAVVPAFMIAGWSLVKHRVLNKRIEIHEAGIRDNDKE